MDKSRKDNKGRVLRTGECQLQNGKYRFKYQDEFGNYKYLYSWKLDRLECTCQQEKGTIPHGAGTKAGNQSPRSHLRGWGRHDSSGACGEVSGDQDWCEGIHEIRISDHTEFP